MKIPLLVLVSILFLGAFSKDPSTKLEECAVSNVYITLQADTLYVSWTVPSAEVCPTAKDFRFGYLIQREGVEDEWRGPVDTIGPGIPIVQVKIGYIYCEQVFVQIDTYDDHNSIATTDEIRLDRDIPPPTGVLVETTDTGLKIHWDPLWDATETDCKVMYTIKYTDQDAIEENTEDTSFDLTLSDLTYCTWHTIEVEASSNGYISEPTLKTHSINIPAVKILSSDNIDKGVFLDFEPLANVPEQCGEISYHVMEKPQECFASEFTIQAVGTNDFHANGAHQIIQRIPGAVNHLKADVWTDAIQVEWQAPTGAENCNILYELVHEGGTISTHSTRASIDQVLPSCVEKSLQVYGIINGIQGLVSDAVVFGNINPVTDVRCSLNGDNVACTWNKPENSDTCDNLQYNVTYREIGGAQNNEITSELNISLPAIACLNGRIFIHPFQEIDGITISGNSVGANIEGCAISVVRYLIHRLV